MMPGRRVSSPIHPDVGTGDDGGVVEAIRCCCLRSRSAQIVSVNNH